MNPFELALRVEVKQPMDLTIPRTRIIHYKGGKEAKAMAKKREERKTRAIKLLEKAQVNYEKQANKLRRHIEFEVGDLVWLNIDFKMFETLVHWFIPKYVDPCKIICKPRPDVYILQLGEFFLRCTT